MFDFYAEHLKIINPIDLNKLESKGFVKLESFVYKYNIGFNAIKGILQEHKIKKESYIIDDKEECTKYEITLYEIEQANKIIESVLESKKQISECYFKSELYSKKFKCY